MATGWRGQYYRYRDFFLNIVSLYKKRRDLRAFFELILSLTTIIIFTVFALKPTVLTIVSLSNQINDKRGTLDLLNQKIGALQKANNIFSQNQNIIPNINASIFTGAEPDTISRQILGLAEKNGISLLGISIGQITIIGKDTTPNNNPDVKPLPENALAMPVSISIKGNYSNLIAFIKDIENLRIPVKVDSLTISSSLTQEGSTIVGIVTARVPFLGQK